MYIISSPVRPSPRPFSRTHTLVRSVSDPARASGPLGEIRGRDAGLLGGGEESPPSFSPSPHSSSRSHLGRLILVLVLVLVLVRRDASRFPPLLLLLLLLLQDLSPLPVRVLLRQRLPVGLQPLRAVVHEEDDGGREAEDDEAL